ncbi:MAG TPA: hypothetical protein PK708_07925 [Candidatus Competibacter sp.]|nr:hypothetical protein [Candidatus Competibacter sp.]
MNIQTTSTRNWLSSFLLKRTISFFAGFIMSVVCVPVFAYAVYGAIGDKYRQLGGEHGVMGVPKSDELPAARGGRYNQFEWGYIFWRGDIGAHNVLYPLDRKWNSMGREGGFGYPITDTFKSIRGGMCNDFENGGTICWNSKTGRANATYGLIRQKWVQLGREEGSCGYPITDEFDWHGVRRTSFEFGYLTWSQKQGIVVHGCASFNGDVQLNPVSD